MCESSSAISAQVQHGRAAGCRPLTPIGWRGGTVVMIDHVQSRKVAHAARAMTLWMFASARSSRITPAECPHTTCALSRRPRSAVMPRLRHVPGLLVATLAHATEILATPLAAQRTGAARGHVFDSRAGQPVVGATISMSRRGEDTAHTATAIAHSSGRFRLAHADLDHCASIIALS